MRRTGPCTVRRRCSRLGDTLRSATRTPSPWLVTAFIPGPTLHQVVAERGPLDAVAALRLGAGLAEGLAAIHGCGLVHRDLKPGNVILAEDGPRIIDFGIARAVDASSLTATGSVIGTYAYMSPEQIRADRTGRRLASGDQDGKVRVWSTSSGKSTKTFDAGASVESLAYSPDGKTLAAGCSDGSSSGSNDTVWLWEVG
ncbi:WD40 repeat domain-containing serine/threonine protein kinase [Streptomyces sp. NPDC014983]|uniref:WD40 repeat domain-containing serine/threonine protein kinase n=1 Tax=Streptomyces sp. NPDC014983 TaxID=3364933 RepID=UPI0036FA7AD5